MSEISITNLNKIISGYKQKISLSEMEADALKGEISSLKQELKELRKRR